MTSERMLRRDLSGATAAFRKRCSALLLHAAITAIRFRPLGNDTFARASVPAAHGWRWTASGDR